MNHRTHAADVEQELAAINAKADAMLALEDDEWEDAVSATASDYAMLCESLVSARGDFERPSA